MLIVAALFIYIIAVIFRLLDNSAGLLIAHGISVSPFYLKRTIILEQIEQLDNKQLIQKLQRNLRYKKIHIACTIIAILTFVLGIIYEMYNPNILELL